MNSRIWAYLMLVAVIALQPVSFVTSLSDVHLVDIKHLQSTHSHQFDLQVTNTIELDEHGHAIQDCHHCGHCSGGHTSWLSRYWQEVVTLMPSYVVINTPDTRIRRRAESKYKPPIYS
ncbi:DUF2946 domain-containing protein [Pseudoalteromonas luteoviolacea]|uniref:DUF2946 domain-containing protein n=1 Tax=Pseudoalteromonas luteoviolacea TaxID=43657 RepID=UPI00126A68B3|nr:DUF2946 domain-containing protein [Pseudoalteromonas luteoviolacea]